MLKTKFWKNAAASLPAAIRERYVGEFERAERWELTVEAVIELLSRAKHALSFRSAPAPR
jgi:hypothetical protein